MWYPSGWVHLCGVALAGVPLKVPSDNLHLDEAALCGVTPNGVPLDMSLWVVCLRMGSICVMSLYVVSICMVSLGDGPRGLPWG